MNTSSSFGFIPYQATASQITSPGPQVHSQHQQQQHQQHHPQQQTLSQQQQQLPHELAQELSSPPPLSLHASSLHSSSSTTASLSGSSTSPISASSSGALLSVAVDSNGNTGSNNINTTITHGNTTGLSGSNNNSNNNTVVGGSPTGGVGPTIASSLGGSQHGGHPTINTAMLPSYGGMLSSPPHSSQAQSSSNSSTPGSILPTTPHQIADLDTILATYAGQPELLKMIIASKTEEDRRWAEEARFRMMDLMLRENRGMIPITGYEGLLAQATGTPGSSITTGNMGGHPSSGTTTATTTSTATSQPSTLTTTSAASATMQTPTTLGLSSSGKRFMDDDEFDTASSPVSLAGVTSGLRGVNGGLGGLGGVGTGGSNGFGQGPDHGLARKRSVTFARDVHHGHLRSQSMSSMPSGPHSISTVTSTPLSNPTNQFGTLSMLGLTGPNTALQQHTATSFQQYQQTPSSSGSLTLQQQYQQQQQQPPHPPHPSSQQQQTHPFSQHQHQQNQHLPPQFGQYPQMFSYHTTLPQLQQQNVIRRTNSLSHLSHIAQSSPHSIPGGASLLDQQQRFMANRPRNTSSSSLRTKDDSDDDSDDDYSDHPVMGGMNSRPGSSLSMNNMMGGNHETSLTLEFSDLASVSGPSGLGQGGYSHQQQHQHQSHHHPSSHHLSSLHGPNSVVSMTMAALGPGAITSTGLRPASALSMTGNGGMDGSSGGNVGVDQKRKRKRREMQPVNKIVDSAEPHIDQFLWKNNGNTTQKKTGCKSIYYKCSNSANGCTVNKTVTEKEGGGYVTKYRGEHLEDCIKLKRAQQAAQAQAAHHPYST
ncbi:hypothetical protein FBU30_003096 [Linnemannia zychae]|nr:hypothetical protein FBU30_003096 [Linnemannia zychae]